MRRALRNGSGHRHELPITLGVTLLLVLAVAVITVPLAGGHLMRLADVRFRAPWL